MADTLMNNKKCIEIMYKMHQCAVFSVYLGKARDVKNSFTYMLIFFSPISDGLGGVFYANTVINKRH